MHQSLEAGQITGPPDRSRGLKEGPDRPVGAAAEYVYEMSPPGRESRRANEISRLLATFMGRKEYINPWQGRPTGNLIWTNLISMWGEARSPEFLYKNQMETCRNRKHLGSMPEQVVEHSVLQLFAPKSFSVSYSWELQHCSVSAISRAASSLFRWQLRS